MPERAFFLLAVAWTLGILVACTLPGTDLPAVPLFSADKLGHFVLFAGLGWLWMHALDVPHGRRLALVGACGLAYAGLTEIYQGFLPWERTPDLMDALANAAGLAAGLLLYHVRRADPD